PRAGHGAAVERAGRAQEVVGADPARYRKVIAPSRSCFTAKTPRSRSSQQKLFVFLCFFLFSSSRTWRLGG
ncbi:MAG TPA: hypothetical protein VFO52_14040, partial [Longimicrobiales bacterium]|nr:hypothetical protein [Longimicrobiales bacterium]